LKGRRKSAESGSRVGRWAIAMATRAAAKRTARLNPSGFTELASASVIGRQSTVKIHQRGAVRSASTPIATKAAAEKKRAAIQLL
jgi:hypothetical protein